MYCGFPLLRSGKSFPDAIKRDYHVFRKTVKKLDLHGKVFASFMGFFVGPHSATVNKISDDDIQDAYEYCLKHKIKFINHSLYGANIARDREDKGPGLLSLVIHEARVCCSMGRDVCCGTNIHLQSGKPEDVASNIGWIASRLGEQFPVNEIDNVMILEIEPGRKTLGATAEGLISTWDVLRHRAVDRYCGLCLDTAHMWSNGTDVTDPEILLTFLGEINEYIGLNNVRLMHLNGNRNVFNTGRDVHAIVGSKEDKMWHGGKARQALGVLINMASKYEFPIIFESTEIDKSQTFETELGYLKSHGLLR
jgi:endonuclease IV